MLDAATPETEAIGMCVNTLSQSTGTAIKRSSFTKNAGRFSTVERFIPPSCRLWAVPGMKGWAS